MNVPDGAGAEILNRFSSRLTKWLREMVPGDERPIDAAMIEQALGAAQRRRLIPDGTVEACRSRRHDRLPPASTLAACLGACVSGAHASARLPDQRLDDAVDELVRVVEMDRLDAIVQQAWPELAGLPHSRQVARVLDWVLPAEDRAVLVGGPGVRAVFKRNGLIPDSLLAHCDQIGDGSVLKPALLAIVFAASIYPQRSYQLDQEVELPGRLRAFLMSMSRGDEPRHAASRAPEEWAAAVVRELPAADPALTSQELRQLMGDLSAVESIPRSFLGEANPERVDRTWGAALYLSTLSMEDLQTLVANWRGERPFLTDLRAYLPVAPSSLVEFRGRPEWAKVRESAGTCLPEIAPTHLDNAVILTQMVWKIVDQLPLSRPNEHIDEFWSAQLTKLRSGFPYYAFLSRFSYWWKMCLHTHPFRRDDTPIDAGGPFDIPDGKAATTAAGGSMAVAGFEFPSLGRELGIEFLQSLHDGYRLVRTTFFRRADAAVSGGKPVDPAEANDEVRRALDALWYERLQRPDEEEGKPEMLQSIAARFPSLGLQTVTNYSHNLPIRMQAYVLARHVRKTNSQIRGIVRTMRTDKGNVRSISPFKESDGWLPVASLARGVQEGRRLFWAFFSHAILYPAVFPQRPDPWDFPRILREIRYWLDAGDAGDAATHRPWDDPPGGIEGFARRVSEMPLFQQVVAELFACPFGAPVYAWRPSLADQEFQGLWQALLSAIPPNLVQVIQPETMKDLRKLFAGNTHWLVPVWYYRYIEMEPVASMSVRMGMDPDEAVGLSEILNRMEQRMNPAGAKAGPVKGSGASAIGRGGIK